MKSGECLPGATPPGGWKKVLIYRDKTEAQREAAWQAKKERTAEAAYEAVPRTPNNTAPAAALMSLDDAVVENSATNTGSSGETRKGGKGDKGKKDGKNAKGGKGGKGDKGRKDGKGGGKYGKGKGEDKAKGKKGKGKAKY